jgi:hypothetical protein
MKTETPEFIERYAQKHKHMLSLEELKRHFIYQAIEDGWSVKKKHESYIFTKKHYGMSQMFEENYLHAFLRKYADHA